LYGDFLFGKMGLGQADQNCTFCVHMISFLYCCCTLGL
jgi:hypothetical protein